MTEIVVERGEVDVTIIKSRWNIYIEIDGSKYVASADSGLTYNDGIWFGTEEEYNEALDRIL